jgi:hypothetical protein
MASTTFSSLLIMPGPSPSRLAGQPDVDPWGNSGPPVRLAAPQVLTDTRPRLGTATAPLA